MKKFILFSIIATLFVIKAIAGTASGSLTVSIIFPDNKLTATSIHSISPPSSLTSFSPEVADYFFNDNNKVILRLWNPKEETDGVQLVYKIIDMGSGDIIKKYVVSPGENILRFGNKNRFRRDTCRNHRLLIWR